MIAKLRYVMQVFDNYLIPFTIHLSWIAFTNSLFSIFNPQWFYPQLDGNQLIIHIHIPCISWNYWNTEWTISSASFGRPRPRNWGESELPPQDDLPHLHYFQELDVVGPVINDLDPYRQNSSLFAAYLMPLDPRRALRTATTISAPVEMYGITFILRLFHTP